MNAIKLKTIIFFCLQVEQVGDGQKLTSSASQPKCMQWLRLWPQQRSGQLHWRRDLSSSGAPAPGPRQESGPGERPCGTNCMSCQALAPLSFAYALPPFY